MGESAAGFNEREIDAFLAARAASAMLLRAQLGQGGQAHNFALARVAGTIVAAAVLPDMVQVGNVWAPPELRGKGYARAVVAGALALAPYLKALTAARPTAGSSVKKPSMPALR